ncbi:YpzG family protein [Neobacillus pocheonensis]|uniref:YpzG family protein n=1 Tax=Neobacillus pocheonensis TaxID=363869 RepID=A0ABT0WC20_9BACI|nr:YpzG family protein [Neobacillus pocheonensis]
MGNQKFFQNKPFSTPWANAKHAHSQINGESKLTQDLIILKHETKKRSH